MNILHINDYDKSGGAETIFNHIYQTLGGDKIVLNNYLSKNKYLSFYNLFFVNIFLYFHIKKLLNDNNYDVILIHNYNLSPLTILFGIRNHNNITQIVHSCGQAGCISSWGVYRKNYELCNIVPNYNKCLKKCGFDKNKIIFSIYYSYIKYIIYFRKKIIGKFIAPSIALTKVLKNNNFKNVKCINNYITHNSNFIQYKQKENILLFVGNFLEYKGVRQVLKSFDKINSNLWEFHLIGKGPLLEELKLLYKPSKNIKFLGFKDNLSVLEYYKKSKIVIIPSICFDNYPTVALEAIANNCKVIGSNRGGIPEIIGEENTFNILDNKNITEKITTVFNDTTGSIQGTVLNKNTYMNKIIEYIK